jgi:hypothetical protein
MKSIEWLTIPIVVTGITILHAADVPNHSWKTYQDKKNGFEYQYPANYFDDLQTTGFRVKDDRYFAVRDNKEKNSFLKLSESLTAPDCQADGPDASESCKVEKISQFKNSQGLSVAAIDLVKTCSGECGDYKPMNIPAFVIDISQDGKNRYLIFMDTREPTNKQTLMDIAQTVKCIPTK